jgi:hypothetical protein
MRLSESRPNQSVYALINKLISILGVDIREEAGHGVGDGAESVVELTSPRSAVMGGGVDRLDAINGGLCLRMRGRAFFGQVVFLVPGALVSAFHLMQVPVMRSINS